jgi:hypothetical protein
MEGGVIGVGNVDPCILPDCKAGSVNIARRENRRNSTIQKGPYHVKYSAQRQRSDGGRVARPQRIETTSRPLVLHRLVSHHFTRRRIMPWIKCSDKMPPPGRLVIVFIYRDYADGSRPSWTMDIDSREYSDGCWHGRVANEWQPTHWMPLPEPPVTESVPDLINPVSKEIHRE